MNQMTLLNERNTTLRKAMDKLQKEMFFEEIAKKEVFSAIRDFMLENPIEMYKSLYILHCLPTLSRFNVNGRQLEPLRTSEIRDYLNEDIFIELEKFQDEIGLDEEITNSICEQIEASYDLGLPMNLYVSETEYFDDWTYGDIYNKTSICYEEEFKKFIADIINSFHHDTFRRLLESLK